LDTIEQDFSSLCKGIGSELKHLSRQVSAGLQLEEERSNEYKAQTANLQEFISHVTLQSQASENARKMLERLSQQAEKERKTTEILKSLTFSQMQLKVGKIEEAHERTFTWIFDGDSSPFREWLARGTGVFWVNGKAGSGKSTLMKYISQSSKTTTLLQSWAGDSQCLQASFYFSYDGTPEQGSEQGLLQSLLFYILRQEPVLAPEIAPERWQQNRLYLHDTWTLKALRKALYSIVERDTSSRFCFFIDGLDEFTANSGEAIRPGSRKAAEDHRIYELAESIKQLAQLPSVKICISSRPWNSCIKAFASLSKGHTLKLEDLTRKDMQLYLEQRLVGNSDFKNLCRRDARAKGLAADITSRAQGVFLWVKLVVGLLLSGLTNEDDFETMKEKLDQLPDTLRDYFWHILSSVEPTYRRHTCRLLTLAQNSTPLPLMAYRWTMIESRDREYAMKLPVATLPAVKQIEYIQEAKPHVNKWTKDLLEVYDIHEDSEAPIDATSFKIDFMHRTVGEFLNEEAVSDTLRSGTGERFVPAISMCRLLLAEAKMVQECTSSEDDYGKLRAIVDRFMFHAKQCDSGHQDLLNPLLHELDLVAAQHVSHDGKTHWTALVGIKHPRQLRVHREEASNDTSDFLAFAVSHDLVGFVRTTLDNFPRYLQRPGRSLLDFALYPTFARSEFSLNPDVEVGYSEEMVQLLLDRGAAPNQRQGSSTVWQLFLLDVWTSATESAFGNHTQPWKVAKMMLNKGAAPDIHIAVALDDAGIKGSGTWNPRETPNVQQLSVAGCLGRIAPQIEVDEALKPLEDPLSKAIIRFVWRVLGNSQSG
jgi:hypothetical protein